MRVLFLCLLLCLLHGISGPATAQSREVPNWVVPVLRLVSTTHVEPTTGVVLSADGLVLVPADFAAPGDEIVVLDGGTDIVRNGRPARLERAFPQFGLEVLQVEGLHRVAAPLAPGSPRDGSSVTLRAFPPAEQIAEGALPVNAAATVSVSPENDTPSVAAAVPLPNVTGPLLDECGNLAGFSLADGVQSLTAVPATQYRWGAALRTVVAELELPVSGIPCIESPRLADIPGPAATEEVENEPALDDTPEAQPAAPEPEVPDGAAAVGEDAAQDQSEPASVEAEPQIETLPPYEEGPIDTDAAIETVTEDLPPAPWPWLVAALIMLAAGSGVYLLRRGRRTEPPAGDNSASEVAIAPAGEEQEASPFAPRPDSRLVLRGVLVDGRSFEVATPVSENAINVEIGRGSVDLVIDSTAVSRRHARMNGTRDALTLTDRGSSNGSSINGVPCLEGEIMYLSAGDQVVLGDACFTVAIEAAPGSGEDE